jgi:hypothetical protein
VAARKARQAASFSINERLRDPDALRVSTLDEWNEIVQSVVVETGLFLGVVMTAERIDEYWMERLYVLRSGKFTRATWRFLSAVRQRKPADRS